MENYKGPGEAFSVELSWTAAYFSQAALSSTGTGAGLRQGATLPGPGDTERTE